MAFFVLCAAIGFLALDARRQAFRQASREASSLGELIALDLSMELNSLDASVGSLSERLGKDSNSTFASSPGLFVLDRFGHLIGGSTPQSPEDTGLPAEALRNAGTRDRYVGLSPSAVDHRLGMTLSRRVRKMDGSFGGIVVGAIELPDSYRSKLERWPHASVLILRDDGKALILGHGGPTVVDKLPMPAALAKLVPPGGRYQGALQSDTAHLICLERVGSWPVTVGIDLPASDIYASWWLKAVAISLVLATFAAIAAKLWASLDAELRRRTRAEGALAASMDRANEANRQLLLSEKIAGVGHWRLAPATGELTWSDETYRIHGIDRATFALDLTSAIEAYHVDDRGEVGSIVQQTIATKGSFDFSKRIVRPDGVIRRVACRGLCELDASSNVKTLFGTLRDVTDLHKAEDALRESEARYRFLAETTSDVITRLDLEFNRTYVSPACRSMLGFEPDELIGKRPSDAIHPDDAPQVRELARALIEGETAETWVRTTYRTRHKDQRWIWVEAGMSIGYDEQTGRPNALICSLRDVTQRREAEAAVEASEARFRLLAENTNELIILGHDDGRRSYISPASERMLGFTPAELEAEMAGKRWVHPADLGYLAEAELATDDRNTSVQCRVRRKDGEWIWVEAIFRRMPQTGDDEPTVIATFRDVTERQASARILNEAREAAETARRAAEQASRAKSDFLATMSHEIRTPLNAILGFAALLEDEPELSAQGHHHLARVKEAGQALRLVVDDILDFSMLEAGRVRLKPTIFRLAALADSSASIVQGLARSKQLDVVVDVDRSAPHYVIGDEDRLRQVLINLLNNAVKFTRQGTITLRLRASEATATTARLRFEVSDTGIGIPDDKRASIFQRFSQVDGSISREFGGTGLGLAICRSLVEAMGGNIGVDSEVEVGSTFWIELSLPVASQQLVREPGAARDPAPPSPHDPSFDELLATIRCEPDLAAGSDKDEASRKLDILLVEDIKLNQELMCALLLRPGHRVDVVGNGSEAIMAVEDKSYDLVLMDLQMPYVDGVSATKVIRGLATPHRFVPIVALTASVLGEQTDAALAAGMDGVLTKPVSPACLDAFLRKAVAGELGETDDAPVVQEDVADQLERAIGKARCRSLRALLRRSLSARFVADLTAATAGPLKAEAHASIAGAGMLGFVRLAALCRAFIAAEDAAGSEAYVALRRELRRVVRTLHVEAGDEPPRGQLAA